MVTPNTTSWRLVQRASTSAQAAWTTVLSVTRDKRAASRKPADVAGFSGTAR